DRAAVSHSVRRDEARGRRAFARAAQRGRRARCRRDRRVPRLDRHADPRLDRPRRPAEAVVRRRRRARERGEDGQALPAGTACRGRPARRRPQQGDGRDAAFRTRAVAHRPGEPGRRGGALRSSGPGRPAREALLDGVNGRAALELVRFGANPLAYLDGLHDDERPIVPLMLGSQPVHLVTKPEHIALALENDDWPPLSRGRLAAFRLWVPGSIVTTSGAEHHSQRDEIWKPLAADTAILDILVERTRRRADSWAHGAPLELFSELQSLYWAADWQALCGGDLDAEPELLAALRLGYDALVWLVLPFGERRWRLPLPQSRRTRAARDRLDAAVDRMVA